MRLGLTKVTFCDMAKKFTIPFNEEKHFLTKFDHILRANKFKICWCIINTDRSKTMIEFPVSNLAFSLTVFHRSKLDSQEEEGSVGLTVSIYNF